MVLFRNAIVRVLDVEVLNVEYVGCQLRELIKNNTQSTASCDG